jgi:hypothetical protein
MADLIDAATIADLTALDESAMNEVFTITSIVRVSDGAGSSTTTTTTTNTIGYFWSVSGDEAGTDQIKAQGRHRVAFPKTVSVAPTAKITQVSTGKQFSVKYPFPVSAYSTSLIIGLEDV